MISPETLRRYPLFAKQSPEMLKEIALLTHKENVDAGFQLFFEGEKANSLYLILEGSVELTMNIGGKGERKIERLSPLGQGEIVGWSAIVKPHIYTLGAQTDQSSRLVVFDGEKLRMLFDENPISGYHFMNKVAEVIGHRLVTKCTQIMSLAG